MTKSKTPDCDKLPAEAQPHARAFLAVAKPYTAIEVARVLTNLRSGVDYMGCGKDHCAASYAKAMMGQRIDLSDTSTTALQALTLEQLSERLKAERARLVSRRQTKAENEARWKRESQERAQQREARSRAVELLAMVLDDMSTCYGECGSDYQFKELSTETVEALHAYQGRPPIAGDSSKPEGLLSAEELLVGDLVAATVAECESHTADESDVEKDAAADRFIRAKDKVLRALRSASRA